MLNFLRSAGAFVLFGAVLLPPAQAMAFDLSGAWATDAGLCSQVFTKKGNEVEFAELSDLFGSGFIIEGSRIRGKSGRCLRLECHDAEPQLQPESYRRQ